MSSGQSTVSSQAYRGDPPSAAAHLRDDLDLHLRAPADEKSSNAEFCLSWRSPKLSEKLALKTQFRRRIEEECLEKKTYRVVIPTVAV